jgi:phage shock protein PspC (stress-responsive transcriptional regulator)
MTRYLQARQHLWFGIAAGVCAGVAVWSGLHFEMPAVYLRIAIWALAGLLLSGAALSLILATRPGVEIHEGYVAIGKRIIPWMDIRRVDRTGWVSPLIVRITLFDDSRLHLIYPGDLDSCNSLLRHVRRLSRDALIDGVPYRQYWGEVLVPGERKVPAPARYRILRPEDEAEVERLYQRLKTVGNLDQKNSADES